MAVAVPFGTAVARDPKRISDADIDALREHFSAEEIVELSNLLRSA